MGGCFTKAAQVAVEVHQAVAQPKPPPKVWCVTLKRTPPEHPDDEPPIGDGAKCCYLIWMVPLALCAWFLGAAVMLFLYLLRCVLLPCLGNAFFNMWVSKWKQSGDIEVAGWEARRGTSLGVKIVLAWISCYKWTKRVLISPLNLLLEW